MTEQKNDDPSFYDLFIPLTTKKVITYFIIIGFVVFFNALFTPFHMDDFQQIVNNGYIGNLNNIPMYFYKSSITIGHENAPFFHMQYRPLFNVTNSIIYSFAGSNPFLFHLIQLIFHIANTSLIYILFSRFFNKKYALVLSLIFLVHPLNSETVIYIANLQDVLFVFFGLLAIVKSSEYKDRLITLKSASMLVILLLVSMLYKETGVVFIGIVLFYTALFSKQNNKRIFIVSSFAFMIYLCLRYFASFSILMALVPSIIQRSALEERLVSIPKIIYYYFSNFFWPSHLAIWQQWTITNTNYIDFYIPLLTIIVMFSSIAILGFVIYRSNNLMMNTYFFFIAWLLISLAMHIQIIPLDFTVADRYFYTPMIGLLGLLALVSKYIFSKKENSQNFNKVLIYLNAILLLVLVILTINRNSYWESDEKLYTHDVVYAGKSPLLYSNYGAMVMSKGQIAEAKYYLEESVKLDPKIGSNINYLAQWHERNKDYQKAKELYLMNIHDNSDLSVYVNIINISYNGLARIALVDERNLQEAKRFALLVLKDYPHDLQALEYLAVAQYFLGEKKESIEIMNKSFQIEPSALTLEIRSHMLDNRLLYPKRQLDGNIQY